MNLELPVFSFYENVVLMIGWIVNNAIWEIMNTTMIAAIPFIGLIVGQWYRARGEGEDEGNKGLLSLNRIEASLYAMLLVYALAAFPLMTVQFAPANIDADYESSCDVRLVAGAGSSSGGGAAIGGETADMPIWWATVHAVSMGLTNAMLAALPCNTDYQYIRTEIDNAAIEDAKLRQEVSDFQVACYGAARARLFRENDAVDSDLARKTDWLGSSYFLNTPGYYDTFQAQGPIKQFAYNDTRDSGRGTVPEQGGYPMCKQWWAASGNGLKARLRNELDPSFMNYFQSAFSSADAEDYAIRGLLTNRPGGAAGNTGSPFSGSSGGNLFSKITGWLSGMAGVTMATIPSEGMRHVASRALPMVQKLTLMAIVIAMPFVVVFSGYSFGAVGLLTFAYIGTATLDFWFQLTRWLQNNLVDMVYHSDATTLRAMTGIGNAYDQGIMGLVQGFMLILFPPLWLAMMSWAGYSIGSGIGTAVKNAGSETGGAGSKGGRIFPGSR